MKALAKPRQADDPEESTHTGLQVLLTREGEEAQPQKRLRKKTHGGSAVLVLRQTSEQVSKPRNTSAHRDLLTKMPLQRIGERISHTQSERTKGPFEKSASIHTLYRNQNKFKKIKI